MRTVRLGGTVYVLRARDPEDPAAGWTMQCPTCGRSGLRVTGPDAEGVYSAPPCPACGVSWPVLPVQGD